MDLQKYEERRDFRRSGEPRGRRKHKPGFSFVVQKHAASHLHYDFRLELDGVLLSWAVPKGPSYDPRTKRLAMQTEDHPVEYGEFEGTIPEGEYGAGTVMVWDRGEWEPEGDPREGYEKGRLKFQLHGEKLRGRWNLIRIGRSARTGKQRSWLLFKSRDAVSEAEHGTDILSQAPNSVQTGRTLEKIRADAERSGNVWSSNSASVERNRSSRSARTTKPRAQSRGRSRARSAPRRSRTS